MGRGFDPRRAQFSSGKELQTTVCCACDSVAEKFGREVNEKAPASVNWPGLANLEGLLASGLWRFQWLIFQNRFFVPPAMRGSSR